jgi:hypothetical protein
LFSKWALHHPASRKPQHVGWRANRLKTRRRRKTVVIHHLADVPTACLEKRQMAPCIFCAVYGVRHQIAPRDHWRTFDWFASRSRQKKLLFVHGNGERRITKGALSNLARVSSKAMLRGKTPETTGMGWGG